MDRNGRAYVATRMGVQVFDRNGRVAGIIPLPGNAAATSLCFGGHDFDTLYVAGGGKVYRRKLHSVGGATLGRTVQASTLGRRLNSKTHFQEAPVELQIPRFARDDK